MLKRLTKSFCSLQQRKKKILRMRQRVFYYKIWTKLTVNSKLKLWSKISRKFLLQNLESMN